jgi:trimeric autotransporter adhesin
MLRREFFFDRGQTLLCVLALVSLFVLSACGGGGSSPPAPQQNNPAPSVTSTSPAGATAGEAATTVTITGTGFVQGSTAQWNQSNRVTTFVSAAQLKITLSSADLSTAGTAQIAVVNPGPGGGVSSAVTFLVSNPAPQVSSVTPSTVTVNDAGSFLAVTGSGFVPTSSATWNGSSRSTTFVSATQLQVKLVEGDLTTAGSVHVAVSNPAPGGGASTSAAVGIVYPLPVVTSLSPSGVAVGGANFTLTVNGRGFVLSSAAQFNGAGRPTAFVNSSQMTMTIAAADIAAVATAQITVVTPAPGGGTSTACPLPVVTYTTPSLTSVQPTSIIVNAPDTAVYLQGGGFTAASTVQVNTKNVPVTYWDHQQLGFTIPAAGLTTVGTLSITVSNPGTVASNAVTITVTPNPQPILTSLSPGGTAFGGAAFTLAVQGSGFVPTSIVRWNGSDRPTTFVNSSQLNADIGATDVLSLGNSEVTVFSPTPGGGTSAGTTFTTYISLPTKDLLYDASRKLLWASVPSSAGPSLGNSVISIDPYTGVLGIPIWVGSEPNKLALSNDGTTLWVSFNGTPSVRKVNLVSGTATSVQPYFPGGWGSNIYASDLSVMPGSPSTVAVAAGFVSIFDNGTARSKSGTGGATSLAFGANSSTLYGYANGLSIFSVDSTGIAATTNPVNSGTYSNDLRYDNGRLYLTSGGVLNSTSGNLLGTFSAPGSVAPDSVLGRAFVVNGDTPFGTVNQITAFDVNTFLSAGSLPVGGVQTDIGGASSLVRWGADGLAFRTDTQIYVLRNALVKDLSGTPADVAVSLTAPATSSTGVNTSIKIRVKNDGPNSASNVVLFDGTPANAIFVSATPSQGSCAGEAQVSCNVGTLTSGATATVVLVVVPTSAGVLANTAIVAATSADQNEANNTASSTTAVTGSGYNPAPELLSIAPQSAPTGVSTLTLTVSGSNFVTTSTVQWNGTSRPTTFVNSNQLTAIVDAALVVSAGSADVTVSNGTPGGGISGALPFAIFRSVALDTNDVVFDPFTRKLYASVPSTATQVAGNSIVSIDPLTGALGSPVFIGSEPTRVSISDDGQYLYTVLSGSNSVRRLNLTTLTPGTQFTTISALFAAAFTASDVAPMPGNHDVVATAGYSDGIQVYDVTSTGATQRPLTVGLVNNVYEGSVLAWGSSTDLYSNDEGLSPSSFHRFTVGPASFAETDSTYLDAVDGKITNSRGLVFSDGGGVVDPSPVPPATPRLVGRFAIGGSSAADASINRVFFLNQNSYNINSRIISAFDATRFTLTGSTELDGLSGDAFDLIRWGADGLAFRTAVDFWGSGTGRVVLLRGAFVLPRSSNPNPVPSVSAASPNSGTAHTGNTWVTITGSQFVTGSAVTWNGSARTTVFVNSGQLQVAIPASDLTTAQTANLRVVNPGPGGGTSGVVAFNVN